MSHGHVTMHWHATMVTGGAHTCVLWVQVVMDMGMGQVLNTHLLPMQFPSHIYQCSVFAGAWQAKPNIELHHFFKSIVCGLFVLDEYL